MPQNGESYPKRPPYWAMRVIRAMTKTAASQHIGASGFALVSLIAGTEDAKRYAGPVTWFNGQLAPLLGMQKWETLDAVRRKVVNAGWLHYTPPPNGSKTVPGAYWTTIPVDVEDGAADEGELPDLYAIGYADGYRTGYSDGESGRPQSCRPYPENGYGNVEHIQNADMVGGMVPDMVGGMVPDMVGGMVPDMVGGNILPFVLEPRTFTPKPNSFDDWWEVWPKKVSKGAAIKAYPKAIRTIKSGDKKHPAREDADAELLEFTKQYAAAVSKWPPEDKRWIPYPATWLNALKFWDDPSTWERKEQSNGRKLDNRGQVFTGPSAGPDADGF